MRKVKVKRVWGKDFTSDLNKLRILSSGGIELAMNRAVKKVFKKKLPLTKDATMTKKYMKWLSKKKRLGDIVEW